MKGLIIRNTKGKIKKYPFAKLDYRLDVITALSQQYFNSDFPCPKELAYIQNQLIFRLDHRCSTLTCHSYDKDNIPAAITELIILPTNMEMLELWN